MVKIKYSHKSIKCSCVFVSIVLVLITIALGASVILATLFSSYALSELEDGMTGVTSCAVAKSPSLNENLVSSDEEIELITPNPDEELIAPSENSNIVSDPTECEILNVERTIIYQTNMESIVTRMHITIVILIVATVISLAIDLAYFALLGTRLPDIVNKKD